MIIIIATNVPLITLWIHIKKHEVESISGSVPETDDGRASCWLS